MIDSLPSCRGGLAKGRVLRTVDEALEHVHAICFKTGPPRRIGVELEWTVHQTDDPSDPLHLAALRAALGDHAPRMLTPASPQQPLPHGATVTVEPGGQVEISTAPHESLPQLHAATTADVTYLALRLAEEGLTLGGRGIDAYRPPRRLLYTPRYDAMAAAFSMDGSGGLTMMCGTAATQVCVDAGERGQVAARWRTLDALGPVLLALFANSGQHAGHDTGWASARMRAWLTTDPARTSPVATEADPAAAWGRYAVDAPLLCVRRPDGGWRPPPRVTFADWIAGAVAPAPTVDDLEYHLTTLFPPVRPRGYLEVRYLDAQPAGEWIAPTALLTALLSDGAVISAARDAAAPADGRWEAAARLGLADSTLRRAAAAVADLGCRALDRVDLSRATRDAVVEIVSRRLAGGGERV